jgi:hypothetical protein
MTYLLTEMAMNMRALSQTPPPNPQSLQVWNVFDLPRLALDAFITAFDE